MDDIARRIQLILNKLVSSDMKAKSSRGFRFDRSKTIGNCKGYFFRIPLGLDHKRIRRLTDAIATNIGMPVEMEFNYGIVLVKTYATDFPKVIPIQSEHFKPSKGLLLGYARDMRLAYHPFNTHLLIGGASNSGKTDEIRSFIYQLHLQGYEIYVCDLKGISFFPFEILPRFHVVDTLPAARDLLRFMVLEIDRRKQLIKKHRDRSLADDFTRYAFIGDEGAVFAPSQHSGEMKEIAKECEGMIAYMGQQSREFKVFSMLCYQRPDKDTINKQYKANVEAAIAFRTKDAYNSKIIIDQIGAERISPSTPGRMLYNYGGVVQELQSPYGGNDDEWTARIAELIQHEQPSRKDYNRIDLRSLGIHASIGGPERQSEPPQESIKAVQGVGAKWTPNGHVARQRKGVAALKTWEKDAERFTDEIEEC